MPVARRLTTLGAGLLAGAVATLAMILLMVAGRYWLGISPPPEAIPDRFAPTLDIETFFDLFERFGGYNGLKKFGIRSGITGLVAAGLLVGLIYAAVVERQRGRSPRGWRGGISRHGLVFVMGTAIALWTASLIVLWPVLDANYRGLPPSWARPVTAFALLFFYVVGYGLPLIATYRFLVRPPRPRSEEEARPLPAGEPVARRAVLAGAAGVALALPSYRMLDTLYQRATFSYDGRPYSGPGVQPVTPNAQFYSVTKNVVDPNVTKRFWRLEVDGLVEDATRYGFDDLAAMEATTQETTLMCISNRIGSGLFSNAVWQGVPMRELLLAAGVKEGAREVRLHAADGYTDTFPIEKALEPTTLVAYRMNDQPIPERHGYPVRVIVPGLYGEKNVKWVTRIEVVDHDAKGFYEQQGWGPDFTVPIRSDIFSPRWMRRGKDRFTEPWPVRRPVTVRGRAFAGNRGIATVEVSVDGEETWQPARIDYSGTELTWTFWSFTWTPRAAGEVVVTSRAMDRTGAPQPTETVGIIPQGARGYHRVIGTVEA